MCSAGSGCKTTVGKLTASPAKGKKAFGKTGSSPPSALGFQKDLGEAMNLEASCNLRVAG